MIKQLCLYSNETGFRFFVAANFNLRQVFDAVVSPQNEAQSAITIEKTESQFLKNIYSKFIGLMDSISEHDYKKSISVLSKKIATKTQRHKKEMRCYKQIDADFIKTGL